MRLYLLGILCIVSLFSKNIYSQHGDMTQTRVEHGLLEGKLENGLAIFKGIPFAAPPVGDLRWKVPQPVVAWNGIKKVTEFARSPYQPGDPPAGKSEDCLYLNVWTPAKTKNEKLPVMV